MMRPVVMIGVIAVVALSTATMASAQNKKADKRSRWSSMLNVDMMVETYVGFLARKYDLNEDQDEFTRQFLKQKADEFMNGSGDEVRALVDRLFDVRTGGEMSNEELQEWGRQATPIYEEAKRLIIDGNDEWREILTDEQRRMHDKDVKLMYQSFDTTETQLDRIVSGELTVEEFRKPNRNRRRSRRPKTQIASRPPPMEAGLPQETGGTQTQIGPDGQIITHAERDDGSGGVAEVEIVSAPASMPPEPQPEPLVERAPNARPERAARSEPRTVKRLPKKRDSRPSRGSSSRKNAKGFEGKWDIYTRNFITRFKLNDAQTQKAYAILDVCKIQGRNHMNRVQARLALFDQKIAAAKKSKDKQARSGSKVLAAERSKLLEPMDRIFERQLKPRLDTLPTRAQRKVAESSSNKRKSGSSRSRKSRKKSGDRG